MPLFLYCLYDPNSHKITSSPISPTMARVQRTPLPSQRGVALRILRLAQARLAAAEAAEAATAAIFPRLISSLSTLRYLYDIV